MMVVILWESKIGSIYYQVARLMNGVKLELEPAANKIWIFDLDPARLGGHWVPYKYKDWLPLKVSLLSGVAYKQQAM
jgi:hypothetical protein